MIWLWSGRPAWTTGLVPHAWVSAASARSAPSATSRRFMSLPGYIHRSRGVRVPAQQGGRGVRLPPGERPELPGHAISLVCDLLTGRELTAMKTLRRLVGIASGVLLFACPALGQQPPGFSFPDFTTTTGLQLVGNAAQFGSALRLTSVLPFQVGGVAPVTKLPVSGGFETRFQFQVTAPAGNVDCQGLGGGDGLAFVIQGSDGFALGEAGGGLGYAGVANSLAVEFDTYCNVELADPNGNHISVQTLGLQPNSADQTVASLGSTGTTLATNLSDGAVHTVRITYVPGALTVFVDDLATPVLQVPVDLESVLGL